jgi:hypothetical protein
LIGVPTGSAIFTVRYVRTNVKKKIKVCVYTRAEDSALTFTVVIGFIFTLQNNRMHTQIYTRTKGSHSCWVIEIRKNKQFFTFELRMNGGTDMNVYQYEPTASAYCI